MNKILFEEIVYTPTGSITLIIPVKHLFAAIQVISDRTKMC